MRAVEPGIQVEVLQAVFFHGQALPLELELPLGGLQGSGYIQAPLELALQARPQLAEARQVQVDLPGQTLLQATAAFDVVAAQADVQGAERPVLPCPFGLGQQNGRLPAQAPLEVEVGAELQLFARERPLTAQRARQRARQFSDPIGRVDGAQVQCSIPADAIGKLHAQVAIGLALPCHQRQLRQRDLLQIATERAAQGKGTRRPCEISTEITLVGAIAVLDLAVEFMQNHLHRLFKRVQALPGKIQPVE
ncbi:hypothetical protein D3C85_777000 [compost metagenome]